MNEPDKKLDLTPFGVPLPTALHKALRIYALSIGRPLGALLVEWISDRMAGQSRYEEQRLFALAALDDAKRAILDDRGQRALLAIGEAIEQLEGKVPR